MPCTIITLKTKESFLKYKNSLKPPIYKDLRLFVNTCARRFELPTPWSVAKCSIQLSYAHIFFFFHLIITLLSSALSMNAGDRNRTGTVSLQQDFKSCASASSATPAYMIMGRGGFEPPKQVAADLQSVPFGHSGICPFVSEQMS